MRHLPLEVTDNDAIHALAAQLEGTAIDVFIQNAGIDHDDGFRQTGYADRLQIFRINTLPILIIAEAFIGHIAASNQKKLVYISSLKASTALSAGHTGGGQYSYRASKAAGNSIIKALSFDLAEQGVIPPQSARAGAPDMGDGLPAVSPGGERYSPAGKTA